AHRICVRRVRERKDGRAKRLWDLMEQPVHGRIRQQDEESAVPALDSAHDNAASYASPRKWFAASAADRLYYTAAWIGPLVVRHSRHRRLRAAVEFQHPTADGTRLRARDCLRWQPRQQADDEAGYQSGAARGRHHELRCQSALHTDLAAAPWPIAGREPRMV